MSPQPRADCGHHDAGPTWAKSVDPAFRHHRLVVLAWAMGFWEGVPDLNTMQAASHCHSQPQESMVRGQPAGAPSQPGNSQHTTARRSTSSVSRSRPWASGSTRQPWCGQTVQHIGETPRVRSSGRQSDPCWLLGDWRDGRSGNRNVLVKLVSRCKKTHNRLSRVRGWGDNHCQLCREGSVTMLHRCYERPALQEGRDRRVSQELRQAAGLLEPQQREQLAHGIFPNPSPTLPVGARQNSCPV